jgi:hypothetical protein
MDNQTV